MYVIEVAPDVFERAVGNPVIDSLDGQVLAPLQVVLSESWTDQERAKFGVYPVVPFIEPNGYSKVGSPIYSRINGIVRETYAVEKVPEPQPNRDVFAELDALKARLDTLETKP